MPPSVLQEPAKASASSFRSASGTSGRAFLIAATQRAGSAAKSREASVIASITASTSSPRSASVSVRTMLSFERIGAAR